MPLILPSPEAARELDRLEARMAVMQRVMEAALASVVYRDHGLYGADGRQLLTPEIQGLAACLKP